MERRTEEQIPGSCLENTAGHQWMPKYDKFPPSVRKRLQESPFNLCAACVAMYAKNGTPGARPSESDYHRAIGWMEEALRASSPHPTLASD